MKASIFTMILFALQVLAPTAKASENVKVSAEIPETVRKEIRAQVIRKFPEETLLAEYLSCKQVAKDELACVFEFGIFRCEDGAAGVRSVDVAVDISNIWDVKIQIADDVAGACH